MVRVQNPMLEVPEMSDGVLEMDVDVLCVNKVHDAHVTLVVVL